MNEFLGLTYLLGALWMSWYLLEDDRFEITISLLKGRIDDDEFETIEKHPKLMFLQMVLLWPVIAIQMIRRD